MEGNRAFIYHHLSAARYVEERLILIIKSKQMSPYLFQYLCDSPLSRRLLSLSVQVSQVRTVSTTSTTVQVTAARMGVCVWMVWTPTTAAARLITQVTSCSKKAQTKAFRQTLTLCLLYYFCLNRSRSVLHWKCGRVWVDAQRVPERRDLPWHSR